MNSGSKTVLITDYAWPTLEPEREILREAGASLLVAETGNEDELFALAPMADGILCNWKPLSPRVLSNASRCLSVGRYGIGLDNIDVSTATSLGIIVTNVPAYCVEDVADHTLALLLACSRKICQYDREIKAGRYNLQANTPMYRLRGHSLGLVGFGKIGRAVAHRALAFGLKVLALKPRSSHAELMEAVEFVDFAQLISRSDYISLHLPATTEAIALFSEDTFKKMKSGVILINTSRGALLSPDILLQALDSGKVAMAGLDVWKQEPLPVNYPLAAHPCVIGTPHSAFYSSESIAELQRTAAEQMALVLNGKLPENVVNRDVLCAQQLRAVLLPP